MSHTNTIINNSIYLYAKMCITAFVNLYTVRLLLSSLGVVDYGIYNIVGGIIAMFLFLNSSMAMVTQRFLSYNFHDKNRLSKIFNITVVVHMLIGIVVILILEMVRPIIFEYFINIPSERVTSAIIVYHISVFTTALTVMTVPYEGVLNAHENMLYYSIVGLFETVLKLTVAIILVYYNGDKLILYGWLTLIQTFLVLGIMRIYCHRKYEECKISIKGSLDKRILKEMSKFLGWNFINQFSLVVSGNGVNLILNHFFGPTLNAAQSVATQVKNQSQALAAAMLKAFAPLIDKSEGEGNRCKMLNATLSSIKFTSFMFLVLAIPIFLQTEEILSIWLEEVPNWACSFIRYVLFIAFLERLFYPLVLAIVAQGSIKGYNLSNALINLIQLPLIYLAFFNNATPDYLYIIQLIISNIITSFVTLYFCHKNCSLSYSYFFRNIIIPIFGCTGCTGSICFIIRCNFPSEMSLYYVVLYSIIVEIVLSICFFYFAITKQEQNLLKNYCINILSKVKK